MLEHCALNNSFRNIVKCYEIGILNTSYYIIENYKLRRERFPDSFAKAIESHLHNLLPWKMHAERMLEIEKLCKNLLCVVILSSITSPTNIYFNMLHLISY